MKKNQNKIAAVLACRVGSSRLFGKPMQKVGKYTILELLIKQIKKSKMISDVVLAISENPGNEVFVEFARKKGIEFVIGSEKNVLRRYIDAAKKVQADIVFRVSTENPFIHWEKIDEILKKHIKLKCDFSTFEPIPLGAGFHIINTNALEKSHKYGTSKYRSEHVDLYIFDNQDKFKTQVFNPEKYFQRPEFRLTVDNPQDLVLVREIYKALGKNDNPIPLKKIIKFLDDNPEIAKINSDLSVVKKNSWT